MCLIAFAWKIHPRYPLALIANRDELHARPSAPAGFDPDAPHVYGGRDLVAGGGWLQASTRRRLAAVTNVRTGLAPSSAPRSRGALVRDFVRANGSAEEAARALDGEGPGFGPFNLLLWDGCDLAFASNRPSPRYAVVTPGIHAMSNGAFDARWPKSALATHALAAWIESLPDGHAASGLPDIEPLYAALADRSIAPDSELPDTGIGIELERKLSPPFVLDDHYGTRCSSIVLVDGDDILFAERRFGPDGATLGESSTVLTAG